MAKRYVILDRDGVINEDSDDFIKSPEEWRAIPSSLEAIALLNNCGYEVVVISNQSGIARGFFDDAMLSKIHEKMVNLLAINNARISGIYYCPHGPDSDCACRKPKSGLFRQFAEEFNADLTETYAIGDSYRDIQAAQGVNAKPILVKTGKGQVTLNHHLNLTIPIFENLYAAAEYICST